MFKELAKDIYYSEPITRVKTGISPWRTAKDKEIFFVSQLISNFSDMKSSILSEVCNFFKISESEALRRIQDKDAIKKDWFKKNRDEKERIEEFYENESFFFGDLLRGKINGMGFLGLRKLVGSLELALRFKDKLGTSYLDYGCGLGASPILFAKHGFTISISDISDLMIAFTSFRLRNRQVKFQAFNLKYDPLPCNTFSFITCFDVLEHAVNPKVIINQIRDALVTGGIVFIYFAYGITEDNPTHIAKDAGLIDDIRKQGFRELVKERNYIMRDKNNFYIFEKA